MTWPPEYSVRESKRAKYVSLKVTLKHGLEVIVPNNFKQSVVDEFLLEKKEWVEHQLAKFRKRYHSMETDACPTAISLPSLKECWRINYVVASDKQGIVARPLHELAVLWDGKNLDSCQELLRTWLKKYAKNILPEWLYQVSKETGLEFKKVCVRKQKTLWGSCTNNKHINLNYKLLLLEPELVRNVLIHELCHTVHLNHSQRFWNLVAKFDQNWQQHNKLLNKAEHNIPLWLID